LQAGGHRFDPGWLHSQDACKHAGFADGVFVRTPTAGVRWKRFGSLSRDEARRSGRVSPLDRAATDNLVESPTPRLQRGGHRKLIGTQSEPVGREE
jgi:hypothetical protein